MKKRIIKDFNNISEEIREEIRKRYPHGYLSQIITFVDRDKHLISALPLETEEVSYLIKISSGMHLGEEEDINPEGIDVIPNQEPLEGLDEEKYLIQEEEEDESD